MAVTKHVSVREFWVNWWPVWEEKEYGCPGDGNGFRTLHLWTGAFYVLTLAWPEDERRRSIGTEIMDSFRLPK